MRTLNSSVAYQPRFSTTVVSGQSWDGVAVVLLSTVALGFPLVTGTTCISANILKYDFLAVLALACAGLLIRQVLASPVVGMKGGCIRILIAVSVILGGYALVLCGPVLEAMLVAAFAPLLATLFALHLKSGLRETRWTVGLLCSFATFVVASSYLSSHQYETILGNRDHRFGLSTFLACMVMFFGGLRLIHDQHHARRVLTLLLHSGIIVGGLGMVQYFLPQEVMTGIFPQMQRDPRPFGTLGHANWYGTYLLLLLPLAIGFAFNQPGRWKWWGLVALLHANLLACQTRGAWVAEIVMLTFVLAVGWRRSAKSLLVLISLIAVVTLLLLPTKDYAILHRLGTFGNQVELAADGADHTGSDRFKYWKYASEHVPDHLLLGAGLDSFENMAYPGEKAPAAKAHSIYFDHALTAGCVGLLLYLVLLGRVFWAGSPDWRRWGFRWMFVAYLVQGVFIHDTIQTWPLLWLLAGLATGPLGPSALEGIPTSKHAARPGESCETCMAQG